MKNLSLDKIPFIALAIFSVLFFLSVNHFDGFDQDCILYTLQAVNRISPDRFIDDPAFMFGNQDSFSLFSPVYLFFIKLFPIDVAAFVFGLLIHCGVAVSFAWLVYKWTEKFDCRKILLPVVLFYFAIYAYGEERSVLLETIRTIEAFPVARTLSVCFGFWGLAQFFDKNKWFSLVLFLMGTAFHPLTVGWGLPLWVFYHFPKFRIPVAVASALFPLTVFVGKEPLAPFPPDWIRITWDMELFPELLLNFLLNLAFLVFLSFKVLENQMVKKFTVNLSLVIGIAYYWLLTSTATHHIFLFQVQTFRALWLCQVVVVFLQFFVFLQMFQSKISKNEKFDIWEKVFVLFVLALWIDCAFVDVVCVFGFLYYRFKDKPVFAKIKPVTLCLWIGVTAYAMYLVVFLFSSPVAVFFANEALFAQKLFGASAGLALVVVFVYPRLKTVVFSVLIACVVFVLMGNQVFTEVNYSLQFIFVAAIALCRTNRAMWGVLLMSLCVLVFANYDHRADNQKVQENAINQFVEEPPFPYIKNRGRVLYSVENFAERLPRIHFLSGAYYDEQYEVGDVFFKGQSLETTAREKKIFLGEYTPSEEWFKNDWKVRKSKASEYLLDRDSLIVRTKYLCSINEITHLITDKTDLPFPKQDSLTLWYKGEKIYLHSCEGINQQ